MILIRPARKGDLKDLYQVAAYLDSMNLPHDKKKLRTLINISIASFSNKIQSKQRGRFLFVAENTRSGRVVGCSAIFSQHGTQQRPHLYFQIHHEIEKSSYLGKTVHRNYATLEKKRNGPTEMSALCVLPKYRKHKEHIGLQLSFARYLYIWAHPDRFKKEFLSELNGVFRKKDGGNELWDALGSKLTGLDYHTADRLSVNSKEFVLALYPKTRFYLALLPQKAQKVLGVAGRESKGAQQLLQEIGFHYLKQCCPFDGGPHFGAGWNEIKLFKKMNKVRIENRLISGENKFGLVGIVSKNGLFILRTSYLRNQNEIRLPKNEESLLKKKMGIMNLNALKAVTLDWPI